MFYDILERRNDFLGYKKREVWKVEKSRFFHGFLKSWKIEIFPKGLVHAFGPNVAIFPTFFSFGNIRKENVFYDILKRKNDFLSCKQREVWNVEKVRFFQTG